MDSGLRCTESILSAERVILSEKWNAKARSLNAKGKDWKAEDWKGGRLEEINSAPLPFFLSSPPSIQSLGFGLVGVKVKTISR